jgi:hypothetical protein
MYQVQNPRYLFSILSQLPPQRFGNLTAAGQEYWINQYAKKNQVSNKHLGQWKSVMKKTFGLDVQLIAGWWLALPKAKPINPAAFGFDPFIQGVPKKAVKKQIRFLNRAS